MVMVDFCSKTPIGAEEEQPKYGLFGKETVGTFGSQLWISAINTYQNTLIHLIKAN